MFVIQAVEGARRWISGVFNSKAAAVAYLALIPGDARANHSVIDLPDLSYPLYICDDAHGFRFLTEAEVAAELTKYARELRRDEEGCCYTNLYRVADDWRPKRPGTDYMGALPHHHVTNFTLQSVEQHGFESLWR